MARIFRRLILTSALAGTVAVAQEITPTPAASAKPSPATSSAPKSATDAKPDQFEEARRIFEKLPPAAQQRFRDNLQRWKDMTPAEQEAMRNREQTRREKIAQEIDDSIQKSGLQLDAEHREVYALRYGQERRKIEEALRKEVTDKRKTMIQEMVTRLKTEFGASSTSSASSPSVPAH